MVEILIGTFFVFIVATLIFLLVATIKRVVVGRKHPRPWNQDPDDYDAEHDLF